MRRLLLALALALALCAAAAAAQTATSSRTYRVDYTALQGRASFLNAFVNCINRGSLLPVVHSAAEQSAVNELRLQGGHTASVW